MATFVLVPGAGGLGWYWHRVAERLAARGHEAVAVLDGGLQAWKQAGGPLSTEASRVVEAPPYPDRPPLAPLVDIDGVAQRAPGRALVDARAPERREVVRDDQRTARGAHGDSGRVSAARGPARDRDRARRAGADV